MHLVRYFLWLLMVVFTNFSLATEKEREEITREPSVVQQKVTPVDSVKPKKSSNVIYRWKDENGTTVLSDQYHEGAETIKVPDVQLVKFPKTPTIDFSRPNTRNNPNFKSKATLEILSPTNNSWLKNNSGNVNIKVKTSNARGINQRLVIELDGKIVNNSGGKSVSIKGLSRGAHTVKAMILIGKSIRPVASKSITFNVRRPTVRRSR